MQIYLTIVPIFLLVALGWFARRVGLLTSDFMVPANRLVFYIGIPAMLFISLAKATLRSSIQAHMVLFTMAALVIGCVIAWLAVSRMRLSGAIAGSFVQSAFHANFGYIGFAVVFYYLGEAGLVRASFLAGFLMILQNTLAVLILQLYAPSMGIRPQMGRTALKIAGNPVICSALAGMAYSLSGLPMPEVAERSLKILSGMALPLALLIIGGSLNFETIRSGLGLAIGSSTIKLLIIPGIAFGFYQLLGLAPMEYLPGLILLACPTATVTYVMAREMGGAPDFAVTTISVSTLFSIFTLTGWLALAR
ncbi:MAG: AEC family transporter [Desulfobacterales bacterium]|jgi:malate permease and related proteins